MTVDGEKEDLGEHLHWKTMDRHEHAREIGVLPFLPFQSVNLCLSVGSFGSSGDIIVVNGSGVPHW